MVGTFYCRSYLGRLWAADTTLQEGHTVISTGPYALVRHPIYTSSLTMYLGTTLAFLTWWTVLVFFVHLVATDIYTQVEDEFLANELAGYNEYRKKVLYRLIPFIF